MYVPFELELPSDLTGALSALTVAGHSKTVALAGGTNLIVDMRAKRERPDRVVGLGKVGELRGMDFGAERITIGGGTTVSDLLRSSQIAESAPSLVESARLFAGLMVRNTATVAGNIACGSPAADLVPPLPLAGRRRNPGQRGAGRERCRSTSTFSTTSATCAGRTSSLRESPGPARRRRRSIPSTSSPAARGTRSPSPALR